MRGGEERRGRREERDVSLPFTYLFPLSCIPVYLTIFPKPPVSASHQPLALSTLAARIKQVKKKKLKKNRKAQSSYSDLCSLQLGWEIRKVQSLMREVSVQEGEKPMEKRNRHGSRRVKKRTAKQGGFLEDLLFLQSLRREALSFELTSAVRRH